MAVGAERSADGLRLCVRPDVLAICRLEPDAVVPAWAWAGALSVVTRSADELSIVCDAASVPSGVHMVGGWRALQVAGPLDFGLTGILAALAVPLAHAGISIFALSTFDTDYVLVQQPDLERAIATLRAAGHAVIS